MARIRAEDRQKVRRRLLETAAAQFAEHGLEGTQIDAVALAAGFAKGTVYNYFASKEDLFVEVLAEGCRAAVQRYAAGPCEGSTRERLRALAEADVAVLREEEGFMKVVVREAMGFRPRTYPLIVEHLAPYLGQVQQVLERGVAAGEIREDRPLAELALAFVGILSLLFVQHWGSGGAWPPLDEIADLAVTLFLDGAGRHEPS
jgi:AcrR family transcriptional regulator